MGVMIQSIQKISISLIFMFLLISLEILKNDFISGQIFS